MRPRLLPAAALAAGCGMAPGVAPVPAPLRTVHAALHADADPTVHGARLLPLEARAPGSRWIADGVRVLEGSGGAAVSAQDRLPSEPSLPPAAVPDRMGGGFLFALGARLWRSDSWLGPARPIASLPAPVAHVWVGLDRVYVALSDGALGAIDPRTGAFVDRGPLPASPAITRFAALDAWHAVAVADLRGAMVTLDAGGSWRLLPLQAAVGEVTATDDSIDISGVDGSRWEVRADGQVARVDPTSTSGRAALDPSLDAATRPFGERPLAAAIEDGWPLSDGTAMVARDGTLSRVRLSDGAIVETATAAFPLRPARCHPLGLARAGDAVDPGAFGFVCGEPGGATVVYRYGARDDRLVELRRFDSPREVLASGNGPLAVRGTCAPDAAGAGVRGAWCVMAGDGDGAWRDLRLEGEDADGARVVVLTDGRVALVRAPHDADLTTARLTVTDGTTTKDLPLALPPLRADAVRALRDGLWLDGFEERRPGVLGGWVDAGGPMVGVEIDLDGHVRVGELLHEATSPFVSGRWGFAWTASRRGFETTDGGMTWKKDLDLPDPLTKPRQTPARACGPAGCLAGGWIRVGWGSAHEAPAVTAPRVRLAPRSTPSLDLECEPAVGPAPPRPRTAAPAPRRAPAATSWRFSPMAPVPCRVELAPFGGHPAPAMSADMCGVQVEASGASGVAQVTAWGPRSGEWDVDGRWIASWLWPWGGGADARRSMVTPAPWSTREDAGRALGLTSNPLTFSLVPGDDADHALLVGRPGLPPRVPTVLELEAEGAVAEIQWPGSEPLPDLLAATRAAGRWFLASSAGASEPNATVVWVVDGATARELARIPRAFGAPPAAVRLARRSDGGAIGLVVDGQASLDRDPSPRWVLAIDVDSGAAADPEPLFSLEGAHPVTACTGDDGGWVLDVPFAGLARIRTTDGFATLEAPLARARLARDHGCIERIEGGLERDSDALDRLVLDRTRRGARSILAGAHAGHVRAALRCVVELP